MGFGITTAAEAMSPRTRQREGRIQSVDRLARSFEFASADKAVPPVLTWSRRTNFYAHGQKVGPDALRPGQRVELRYGTPLFSPPYVSKVRVLSLSVQSQTRKPKPCKHL